MDSSLGACLAMVQSGMETNTIMLENPYRAKLTQLQRAARTSATWRDHTLGAWGVLNAHARRASCVACNAYVDVDAQPPANGIDIGGTAVALNCTVRT